MTAPLPRPALAAIRRSLAAVSLALQEVEAAPVVLLSDAVVQDLRFAELDLLALLPEEAAPSA